MANDSTGGGAAATTTDNNGGSEDGGAVLDGGAGAGASSTSAGAAGDGGSAAPAGSWMDNLDDDVRAGLAAKDFGGANDLARAYMQLESKIGEKGVVPPKDGAPPEEVEQFYKALGRPDDPGEYQFAMPEGAEPTESDKAFQGAMASILHKAGLTQAQVDVINQGWNEYNGQLAKDYSETVDRQYAEAEAALKKELGGEFDAKMEAGNLAVRQLGGEELANYLAESGMGRDPRFLNFLIKAGEALSGDGELIDGQRSARGVVSTPGQAQAEIDRIRGEARDDPKHPYNDKKHPEHDAIHKRVNELYAMAGSGE